MGKWNLRFDKKEVEISVLLNVIGFVNWDFLFRIIEIVLC